MMDMLLQQVSKLMQVLLRSSSQEKMHINGFQCTGLPSVLCSQIEIAKHPVSVTHGVPVFLQYHTFCRLMLWTFNFQNDV